MARVPIACSGADPRARQQDHGLWLYLGASALGCRGSGQGTTGANHQYVRLSVRYNNEAGVTAGTYEVCLAPDFDA